MFQMLQNCSQNAVVEPRYRFAGFYLLLMMSLLSQGCSSLISSVTTGFAEDLGDSILNNPDAAMVRDGAPAYLILIDSLLARSPDDDFMLRQSSTLHSAYAAAFVEDETRAKLLHTKARDLGFAAACVGITDGCELRSRPFKDFQGWVQELRARDVAIAYTLATSWTGWIQANSSDYSAIADLARVKAIMEKTAELAPEYESGGVFLYLGVFETLVPPALGGKPELGREYFERALELSNGANLLAKVMFAEQYGRLVYNRELHDQLLHEVMQAPLEAPGYTLMNSVAKERAEKLLESADEYF